MRPAMDKSIPNFDMIRACMVKLIAVDGISEKDNHIASGVALRYRCSDHGNVTIVAHNPAEVADMLVWVAYHAGLQWGEVFGAEFDRAQQIAMAQARQLEAADTGDGQ